MNTTLITSPIGVMTLLVAVVTFWFWLERSRKWKLFEYLPPLVFIYASPVLLSNTGVIPFESAAYDFLRHYGLPIFIVLMLVKVDVISAVRIMGKGVFVMLLGSFGVVFGGVVAYKLGQTLTFGDYFPLAQDSWRTFGTLAGSWIGGTGNMAATHQALEGSPEHLGLAVLADNLVYVVWLPILLGSRAFADKFNKWARVPEDRIAKMEQALEDFDDEERPVSMRDYLNLGVIALGVTWASNLIAPILPVIENVISTSTWVILLITTFSLALSVTPARHIPGSHNFAMAVIYVFVAGMGARASLGGLSQAPAFVMGAFVWISIHGMFCLAGSWLFKVDVHSAAIASAANIGGAASAPVVAAYHRPSLVPVSILMALIGYAIGNYLAILTGVMAGKIAGAN